MNNLRLYLSAIFLASVLCMRFEPGRSIAGHSGPYIDSLGLRASLARIDNVESQSTGSLIKEALEVPANNGEAVQADFFQSLEEDYQKYLKLFKFRNVRRATCPYDLLETFRAKVYDPQPFMNAILHTMTLREITTLDYTVQSDASDTIHVQVSWAKATPGKAEKSFGITEGTLPLIVTKHEVSVAGNLPKMLQKNTSGKN